MAADFGLQKSCKYSSDEEDSDAPTPKANTKPKHHAKVGSLDLLKMFQG
jgi:hypothetical protein